VVSYYMSVPPLWARRLQSDGAPPPETSSALADFFGLARATVNVRLHGTVADFEAPVPATHSGGALAGALLNERVIGLVSSVIEADRRVKALSVADSEVDPDCLPPEDRSTKPLRRFHRGRGCASVLLRPRARRSLAKNLERTNRLGGGRANARARTVHCTITNTLLLLHRAPPPISVSDGTHAIAFRFFEGARVLFRFQTQRRGTCIASFPILQVLSRNRSDLNNYGVA